MPTRLDLLDMPVWPAPVTPATWPARRADILARGRAYLGAWPARRCPLDARCLDEQAGDGYRRLRVSFRAEPDDRVTAYLLIPDAGRAPYPAMIAVHTSASAGKDATAGLSGLKPDTPPDPLAAYGLAAVRRGWLVLAPDLDTVGERATGKRPWDSGPFYRRHPAWSQLGKAAWDLSRCVDFLTTRPDADRRRVACMGHCFGAYTALLGAAFEDRIQAVLLNSGIWTFRGQRWSRHARDPVALKTSRRYWGPRAGVWSALPWRPEDARFAYHLPPVDMYELAACLAPRPLWLSAPEADLWYRDPAQPNHDAYRYEIARQWLAAVRQVYRALGRAERFEAWIFEGPHGWAPEAVEAALDFLERCGPARGCARDTERTS